MLPFTVLFGQLGCIYPIYKTLQRESAAQVVSERGSPIEGVRVTLISSAYPYGFEKSRQTKPTDSSGHAHFDSVREWRIEALFIHGAEFFFWNWCVDKDGYETIRTQWQNEDSFEALPTFTLKPGVTKPCEPPLER